MLCDPKPWSFWGKLEPQLCEDSTVVDDPMFFEASRLLEYVDRRNWTKSNRELSLKWSSPRPCSFRSSNFCCTLHAELVLRLARKRDEQAPLLLLAKVATRHTVQGQKVLDTTALVTSVVSKIIKLQWFRAPIKKCVLFWMLCYWCCHISNKMLFGVKSVDHQCSTLHLFNQEVSWHENPI